jgi:hypothetical protein
VRTIQHPLSGATYDLQGDGNVRVESRDGRVGVFDARGTWLGGELRQADPHLCLWIAGRDLPNRFQQAAAALAHEATSPQEEPTP